MRIGILGQPCIDEIIHPGKQSFEPKRALGGVLYSYAAMERLMRECGGKNTFAPLTLLSNLDRDFLSTLLRRFDHMEHSVGLWPTDSLTNRVQLVYQEDGHRSEHCPHILPRLTEEQITASLCDALDGLFINMISGFDVALETLETALNHRSDRLYVHLDVHALVLGPLSQANSAEKFGGGREPRGVSKWKRWLALADSVQMNEFEARWLADPEMRSEEDLLRTIERMDADDWPKQVIVTRAERGASVYDLEAVEAHHIPAPETEAIETTGSGDVFGAAYIFSIMAGMKPEDAMREAVNWATWNTTLPSIEQILEAQLFHR